jgi:hypothetical protein
MEAFLFIIFLGRLLRYIMLNLVRKYVIPAVQNKFFRIFILVFVLVQIVSGIARWSDKAYKEDMKWERPPDRLPDIVDATIQMHNQDAKVQQAVREFDRALATTPTIHAPMPNQKEEEPLNKNP